MRIILFRGYDAIGDKGWVYGDLVHNQRVTVTGLQPRVMVGGYEVLENTVGQFTGLKDKNGNKIFEGDLIRYVMGLKRVNGEWVDNAHNYVVEFDGCYCNIATFRFATNRIEVIGNIYENPTLSIKQ